MNIADVAAWMNGYLDLEYRISRARLNQDERYGELRREGTAYWADRRNSVPYLPIYGERTDFDRAQLKQLWRRQLYRVSRHGHPQYGEMARCVLSADSSAWDPAGYHCCYDAAWVEDGLRIIAEYGFCPGCFASGAAGNGRCGECSGSGWKYIRGDRHDEVGPALELVRIAVPDDPRFHRAHEDGGIPVEADEGAADAVSGEAASADSMQFLAAVQEGDLAEVGRLLDLGADLDASMPGGYSALHVAVDSAAWRQDRMAPSGGFKDGLHERCLAIVKLLAARGAKLDAVKEAQGETPLMDSASYGLDAFAAALVEAGAAVDGRDGTGRTPLMAAAARGHVDAVQVLCRHGADVNAALGPGFTVMHTAAEAGEVGVGMLLVDWGADFEAGLTGRLEGYGLGDTPLDVARKRKQQAFAAWLQEVIDAV